MSDAELGPSDKWLKALGRARQNDDAEEQQRICNVLGRIATKRGLIGDALAWHKRELQLCEPPDSPDAATAWQLIGEAHLGLGNLTDAITAHKAQLRIASQLAGDGTDMEIDGESSESEAAPVVAGRIEAMKTLQRAYVGLCNTLRARAEATIDEDVNEGHRDLSAAVGYGQQALNLATKITALRLSYFSEQAGSPDAEAEAMIMVGHINLGAVKSCQESNQEAVVHYEHALLLAQKLKQPEHESQALSGLGRAHLELNQLDRAEDYGRKELRIAQALHAWDGQAVALCNLGNVYYKGLKFDKAKDSFSKYLQIASKIRDEGVHTRRAEANLEMTREAIKCVDEIAILTATLSPAGHQKWMDLDTHFNIGILSAKIGDYAVAARHFKETYVRMKGVPSTDRVERKKLCDILGHLGDSLERAGDLSSALNYCRLHLEERQRLDDIEGSAVALNNLGNVYEGLNNEAAAVESYRESKDAALLCNSFDIALCAMENIEFVTRKSGQKRDHAECVKEIENLKAEIGRRQKNSDVPDTANSVSRTGSMAPAGPAGRTNKKYPSFTPQASEPAVRGPQYGLRTDINYQPQTVTEPPALDQPDNFLVDVANTVFRIAYHASSPSATVRWLHHTVSEKYRKRFFRRPKISMLKIIGAGYSSPLVDGELLMDVARLMQRHGVKVITAVVTELLALPTTEHYALACQQLALSVEAKIEIVFSALDRDVHGNVTSNLSFESMGVSDDNSQALLVTAREAAGNIGEFSFSCNFDFGDLSLRRLLSCSRPVDDKPRFQVLTSLDLSVTAVTSSGVAQLSRCVEEGNFPSLEHLDLSFNPFNKDIEGFAEAMYRCCNHYALKSLDLSRCFLGPEFAERLSLLLSRGERTPRRRSLLSLDLKYNLDSRPYPLLGDARGARAVLRLAQFFAFIDVRCCTPADDAMEVLQREVVQNVQY